MITKFSPNDKVGTKVPIPNGVETGFTGTVKVVAATDPEKIQYEIELDKPLNGNSFLWFYENELYLLNGRMNNE